MEDLNTVGIDTVIYKLKIGSDTDRITLTASEYTYTIRDAQNRPLGTIEIQKNK